jgi:hypothetical protein
LTRTEITIQDYEESFSDFYKEAYGVRPRGINTSNWTLENWKKEWELLHAICESNREAEEIAESHAIYEFELQVQELIEMGAKDRDTAIRWIADAEQCQPNSSQMCYVCGLPYGYFNPAQ